MSRENKAYFNVNCMMLSCISLTQCPLCHCGEPFWVLIRLAK
jgi:hypothetical protein